MRTVVIPIAIIATIALQHLPTHNLSRILADAARRSALPIEMGRRRSARLGN